MGATEMQVPEPSHVPAELRNEAELQERDRKARALYGRARTLEMAGRCPEARRAYWEYAALVRTSDPAGAEMALRYAGLCRAHAQVDPRNTAAVDALFAHDYAKVLALTERPAEPQTAAWLDLDRASAFVALQRTDEAVFTYRRAAQRFAEVGDAAGRDQALWGAAHALDVAGRCSEAKRAYDEYARFVRPIDPFAAQMAATYAGRCRPVVRLG